MGCFMISKGDNAINAATVIVSRWSEKGNMECDALKDVRWSIIRIVDHALVVFIAIWCISGTLVACSLVMVYVGCSF